ncbi:hypothetical protein GALMADRAFT_1034423 [Galerina marginata CBS 339.88]|uniref:G domain-containing protein n=1 Tax=Galerina marginata (strain CBS 339.88) TaxID=685588 RepID=A0A067SLG8_GALM3|nr:hypothetical protein GALMADRAFT_1034423 [Galerina marginata CBS 339.88]
MSVSSTLTTVDTPEILSIAVMGPTGTGKTSFINLLSGSNLRVGSELESCTSDVQISEPFELDSQVVTLIDTPGFDDTRLSDTNVLNMIAAYLSSSHAQGKHLTGVIYMHRILDNRLGGISARNFRLFRSLCGEDSLRSVVIATTMWDQIEEITGEDREKELVTKDVFFKPAVDKGARMVRHFNTFESAQNIVRSIIQQSSPSSVTLQIQEELGNGLDISETRAGKELSRDLFEQMERHRQEMRGLMVEIQEATRVRDEESRRELTLEHTKMEAIMTRLQVDSTNTTRGYRDALAQMEERLRIAQASAGAARPLASQVDSGGGGKIPGGNEYPGQQTHSPIVQAVAATENSNAVLEGKIAAAIPIVGFWGRLAVMLAPFSLTWR